MRYTPIKGPHIIRTVESVVAKHETSNGSQLGWILSACQKILREVPACASSDGRFSFETWKAIRSLVHDIDEALISLLDKPQESPSDIEVMEQSSFSQSLIVDADSDSEESSTYVWDLKTSPSRFGKKARGESPSQRVSSETPISPIEVQESRLFEPGDTIGITGAVLSTESADVVGKRTFSPPIDSMVSHVSYTEDTEDLHDISSRILVHPTDRPELSEPQSQGRDYLESGKQRKRISLVVNKAREMPAQDSLGFSSKSVVSIQNYDIAYDRLLKKQVLTALRDNSSLDSLLPLLHEFGPGSDIVLAAEDSLELPPAYFHFPQLLLKVLGRPSLEDLTKMSAMIYRLFQIVYQFSQNNSRLLPLTFLQQVSFSDDGLLCNLETDLLTTGKNPKPGKKAFFCMPTWLYVILREYDRLLQEHDKSKRLSPRRDYFLFGQSNPSEFWKKYDDPDLSGSVSSKFSLGVALPATASQAREQLKRILQEYDKYYKEKNCYHTWFLIIGKPIIEALHFLETRGIVPSAQPE